MINVIKKFICRIRMEVLFHRPDSGSAIPLIRQTFPGILTKIDDSATNGHHYIQLLLTFCHDLTNQDMLLPVINGASRKVIETCGPPICSSVEAIGCSEKDIFLQKAKSRFLCELLDLIIGSEVV